MDIVCQLLMPTKTKKMDLYEEKPVLELSGGADGPRLWCLYYILLLECVTTGEEKGTHCYHQPGSLGVLTSRRRQ